MIYKLNYMCLERGVSLILGHGVAHCHSLSCADTLVSKEKPGFQALSKGLIVLLCAEVVRQGVPANHGAVHSRMRNDVAAVHGDSGVEFCRVRSPHAHLSNNNHTYVYIRASYTHICYLLCHYRAAGY